MLREIHPYIEQSLSSEFVTAIPIDCTVPRGKLHTVDLKEVAKKIAKGLRHILPRNLIAIGGIDVSPHREQECRAGKIVDQQTTWHEGRCQRCASTFPDRG